MIVNYFFLIISVSLLLAIFIINILSQQKYKESKIIYINNPFPPCVFTDELPLVRIQNLETCVDEKNNFVDDYYVYNFNSSLPFVVTNKKQAPYMNICNDLCPSRLLNGNCNNQTPGYTTCIDLLETPFGCTNPAKPVFVDANGIEFFAVGIFPSPRNNCVSIDG
jgi:hypothetical protein